MHDDDEVDDLHRVDAPLLHHEHRFVVVETDEIDETDIVVIYLEMYNIMLIEVGVEHEILGEVVEFDIVDDEAVVIEL